jgi:hypothetical protein
MQFGRWDTGKFGALLTDLRFKDDSLSNAQRNDLRRKTTKLFVT